MQAIILFLMPLIIAEAATDHCLTYECQAERQQAWIMKGYQRELSNYKKRLEESSCSICNIDGLVPCRNNGTCIEHGKTNFTCNCPDNTTGDRCETILSCEDENPCAPNAICFVASQKKNCRCPPGSTGDPKVECTIPTKKASLWGDPHFTTFDNATYDYMGTCPYYLMKACNSSLDFSIQTVNELNSDSANTYRTHAKSLTFKTQGHEFTVDKDMLVYVDNVNWPTPYYWPSSDSATIIITKPYDTVVIYDTITQANITFVVSSNADKNYAITIEVPLTSFFYGPDVMCGLFGNLDNNCNNDIRASDGSFLIVSDCSIGANQTVVEYLDTWVTNSTFENCIEGQVIVNNTNCTISEDQQQCDLIRQAIDGVGPFGACAAMGNQMLNKFYHDCTYEICNNNTMCAVLDIFAKLCLNYLPVANIDNWRPENCPYKCPPYSRYSLKTPNCQNSCADPNYSNSSQCQESFLEGCICDPGYYYDSNGVHEGFEYVCRPLNECGCVDNQKIYHLPDTKWLNVGCSAEFVCYDGMIASLAVSCSQDGFCTDNGNNTGECQCLQGFSGDGLNCTDINECEDLTLCSVDRNQGKCNNLPGSYNCTCYAPYGGPQCTEYMPSRHCADHLLFHGSNESGVYSVSIGVDFTQGLLNNQLNWTEVYCDMESLGGGWTLMAHGNLNENKTFAEYVNGFGDAVIEQIWLGLENIHAMTHDLSSLRVIIESCPNDNVPVIDCTYQSFRVLDSSEQYAVFVNGTCLSNTNDTVVEGWAIWDVSQVGPVFSTFDKDSNGCSQNNHNTGWWYGNMNRCGIANLNGVHFACDDRTDYGGLTWNYKPIKDARMFLRPKTFPNYDPRLN